MFDFGNANDGQRQAIATADGPVLITAGPGTGKTYTLVQRTIYLIEECDVRPESIFIATFTEKAAKELVTRINKRTRKSKYHGKHQRNVYRYVPRTLPSYIERALGIHTTSPKLSLDGFV